MPPVDPAPFVHFTDLHLSPVALSLGFFQIRWYSLAYITGILVGWWYLLKLLDAAERADGAPPCRRLRVLGDARAC